MLSNLGLEKGMALKLYTSEAKGLKLKVIQRLLKLEWPP